MKETFTTEKYENTIYQNLGDGTKAILRGKFLTLTIYIREKTKD